MRRLGQGTASLGALVLAVSLFLTWSHERTTPLLARFGSGPALAGVPAEASAWQVYASADAILLALAIAIVAASRWGGWTVRGGVAVATGLGLAFVVHALAKPPTAGLVLATSARGTARYLPDLATSGPGEILALFGLGLGLIGLLIPRLTSDPE